MFRDRVGEGEAGFWYESRDFSQSEHRWVWFLGGQSSYLFTQWHPVFHAILIFPVCYFSILLGGRVHIYLPSGTHLDAPAHFSKGKWRVGIFYYD